MVTKQQLRSRVRILNEELGRPVEAYRSTEPISNRLVANVGHILLNANSPGDGWTRYTLAEIVNEQGGERNLSRCANASEMDYILDTLFRACLYGEFEKVPNV